MLNHTKMGAQVRRVMAHGDLVSDDMVESVVGERLTEHDWTVWKRWPWLVEAAEDSWTNPPGLPRVPPTFTLLAERAEP